MLIILYTIMLLLSDYSISIETKYVYTEHLLREISQYVICCTFLHVFAALFARWDRFSIVNILIFVCGAKLISALLCDWNDIEKVEKCTKQVCVNIYLFCMIYMMW